MRAFTRTFFSSSEQQGDQRQSDSLLLVQRSQVRRARGGGEGVLSQAPVHFLPTPCTRSPNPPPQVQLISFSPWARCPTPVIFNSQREMCCHGNRMMSFVFTNFFFFFFFFISRFLETDGFSLHSLAPSTSPSFSPSFFFLISLSLISLSLISCCVPGVKKTEDQEKRKINGKRTEC